MPILPLAGRGCNARLTRVRGVSRAGEVLRNGDSVLEFLEPVLDQDDLG